MKLIEVIKMNSKYYCCIFVSFDALQKTLNKVNKSYDAKVIAQSLESRLCSGSWIRAAWNRYFELVKLGV